MRASLADVCLDIADGTHSSPPRVETGVPVLSAQNVHWSGLDRSTDRFASEEAYAEFCRRFRPQAGDVLMTIVGTIGRVCVLTQDPRAMFQRSVAFLRPNPLVLDASYLAHITQSRDFQDQLTRSTNVSSQAGVYLGRLRALQIPLPSLEEQRRIAAILDQADAIRTKRRQVLDELRGLPASIFQQMFGYLGSHTSGARTVTIAQSLSLKSGSFLPARAQTQGPYPVYGGNGINGYHAVPLLNESTVVVGRVGAYCGAVHLTSGPCWVTDNALIVGDRDRRFRNEYLKEALARANLNQYANRSGQPLISASRIGHISLLVPDLAAQNEYAQHLSRLANTRDQVGRAFEKDAELFEALQARAFSGEL